MFEPVMVEVYEMPLWFRDHGLQIMGLKQAEEPSPFHSLFPNREVTHLVHDRGVKSQTGVSVTCREEYIFLCITSYSTSLSLSDLAALLAARLRFDLDDNSTRERYPSKRDFTGI